MQVRHFVGRYGYYAHGKFIDQETLNLPRHLLESFLQGYEHSDGCKVGNFLKASTVSRELCFGIAQCVAKVHHRPFAIYRTARKPKTQIEGRIVNQRDSFQIVWKETSDSQDKAFYEDGYIWYPLSKLPIIDSQETIVYNLSVEEDESYTANGAIVHNCQDISAAGLQGGLKKDSETRSSLLWECERAIKAKRPKYLLMENVKALVSNKFIGDFHEWIRLLEGYGYETFSQVLNAKDYGVPQNRERIFAVSILMTEDDPNPRYFFPKPFPLEKCLSDVLEEDVADTYFLKEEMLARFCEKSIENETP